jgi:hypothetical protein
MLGLVCIRRSTYPGDLRAWTQVRRERTINEIRDNQIVTGPACHLSMCALTKPVRWSEGSLSSDQVTQEPQSQPANISPATFSTRSTASALPYSIPAMTA